MEHRDGALADGQKLMALSCPKGGEDGTLDATRGCCSQLRFPGILTGGFCLTEGL